MRGLESLIIPSPVIWSGLSAGPVLVPMFEALANTTRASLVGSIAADADRFSAPVHLNSPSNFVQMVIKAPGTAFYVPPHLAQFESAVRKIVEYQYGEKNAGSKLRTGNEYCNLLVSQYLSTPGDGGQGGPVNEHFDIDEFFINGGMMEKGDRYVVSDAAEAVTAFYNADFSISKDFRDSAAWQGMQNALIRNSGAPPFQFKAYDITHFDNTTPHAAVLPWSPVLRTFLTIGFTAQKTDILLFNNPDLVQAYERVLAQNTPRPFCLDH